MKKNIAFLCKRNQSQLINFLAVFIFCVFTFVNAGWSFSQEEVMNFYFDPPNGTTFIETVRTTQEIKVDGAANSDSKISESKSQFEITRKDFGYSVVNTPIHEGGIMEDDIEAILSSLTSSILLTYDLDHGGKLIRVQGMESGLQDLKSKVPLPPEIWDYTLELYLGGRTPEQMAKYQWINRGMLGIFVGQTMIINQEFSQNGNMPLPDGSIIQALVSLKITEQGNCNGHPCAKIRVSYLSDDSIMGDKLTEILKNMFAGVLNMLLPDDETAAGADIFPKMEVYNPKVLTESERIVDPATGLIYSEVEMRTIHLSMRIDGEADFDFQILNKTVYSYNYLR